MTQKIRFETSEITLDISTKRLLKEVVKEKLPVVDLPGVVTYKNVCSYVHGRLEHIHVFTLLVRVTIKSRKSLKGEDADIVRESTGLYGVDIFTALHGVEFPPEEEFIPKNRGWVLRVVVYKIDIFREEE